MLGSLRLRTRFISSWKRSISRAEARRAERRSCNRKDYSLLTGFTCTQLTRNTTFHWY